MVEFLVITCLVLVFYSYFGYPAVLWLMSFSRKPSSESEQPLPRMSVIIAARNEEEFIEQKLNDTLQAASVYEQAGGPSAEILVASDQSDDQTDTLVKNFQERGVRLVASVGKRGKEEAQKQALAKASGEIVVFTDAKTTLEPSALLKLAQCFSDPSVGAVSSRDAVVNAEEGGEGLYVRYEMFLRKLESRFHSLVGLSGSCFAVRKSICEHFRTDIPSDFGLLLAARAEGLRGVHADGAICYYRAVGEEEKEFPRKIRTVLRGLTTFFGCLEAIDIRRDPLFAWQIISHKLFRWLVPWFLLLSFLGTVILASGSTLYTLLLFAFLSLLGLAALGYLEPSFRPMRVIKVPLFFCLTNSAIALAWIDYWRGKRVMVWEPTARLKEEKGSGCFNEAKGQTKKTIG